MKIYTLTWKYEPGISGVYSSEQLAKEEAITILDYFPETKAYMHPVIEEWDI